MARGSLTAFAQVAAGAVAGGGLRILLTEIWPSDGYPWTIVAINLAGSVAIGWFAGSYGTHWRWWPLVGPGVLGGFTTFSAVAVAPFSTDVSPALSVALLAVAMVVCAVGATVGRALGSRGSLGDDSALAEGGSPT